MVPLHFHPPVVRGGGRVEGVRKRRFFGRKDTPIYGVIEGTDTAYRGFTTTQLHDHNCAVEGYRHWPAHHRIGPGAHRRRARLHRPPSRRIRRAETRAAASPSRALGSVTA